MAGRFDALRAHVQKHWMIWLGGFCLALGGIFLVRYSIDSGLLGPGARIILALVFGLAFHGTAEFLRQRAGAAHGALGALAGAGSVTLYGAVFAATRMYQFLDPGVAFALMAVIALATMVMARLHGPLLAAFGILGAYLVPLLLSTGSGDLRAALLYALIVSASALLLMRYVFRPWLWWGFVIGAFGWWLLSLGSTSADGWRTPYLTFLLYFMATIPTFDWLLRSANAVPIASYDPRALWKLPERRDRYQVFASALALVAVAINVLANPDTEASWPLVTPFLVLSLLLTYRREQLYWLPWMVLLFTSGAWFFARLEGGAEGWRLAVLPQEDVLSFCGTLAMQTAITVILALRNFGTGSRAPVWASLAALAPVLALVLAYMLTQRPETESNWGLVTTMGALTYLCVAAVVVRRQSLASITVWLVVGGHLGLAIAVAMLFSAASLTLALAAQILSLAWIIVRFELPSLGWLLKLVVAMVVVRLSLNPWLLGYPSDIHWSLWTYGGSTLFAAAASRLLSAQTELSKWTEGAAFHLLVLTLWAELRYGLYDGKVYAPEFSFLEATVMMLLFATLALVYFQRAQHSQLLSGFLLRYAKALAGLSLVLYVLIGLRVLDSAFWIYSAVGATPLMNLGAAAFAGPVLMGLLFARYFEASYRRRALLFSGLALFLFVSLQIRHLWTGNIRLNSPSFSDGELYTYSAVWLAMAIAAVLAGASRLGRDTYRAGLGMLALVILKLFLFDLSDLEGLLRVASFMGLGLALLGISFLHRHLGAGVEATGKPS